MRVNRAGVRRPGTPSRREWVLREDPLSQQYARNPDVMIRAVVGLVLVTGITSSLAADSSRELSPSETRGRRIYRRGTTEDGRKITALFGDGATPIPASALPCGNCHGPDGKGRPEGGVVPTDITWVRLTKP